MTGLKYTHAPGSGRWATVVLSKSELELFGDSVRVEDGDKQALPCQLDASDGGGELVIDLSDAKGDDLLVTNDGNATAEQISVETAQDYQGQPALLIHTPVCTWVYHTDAGGFASIIDKDEQDWISFRPWGGSDGIYRGIPNLAFPENVFHPGHQTCVTDTPVVGPLRVTLNSRSKDGKWACKWHVYADHAELEVLQYDHPYWLLYEGTPGGKLEEDKDFTLVSDGRRRPISERWDEVLPEPKWIAFGKPGLGRMLWLHSHSPENRDCRDSCYAMEQNMTVFGFGRVGMAKTMDHAPARFTVGLTDVTSDRAMGEAIAQATQRITPTAT